jgi:hypothetical protein
LSESTIVDKCSNHLKKMTVQSVIPMIDLISEPGGLCEMPDIFDQYIRGETKREDLLVHADIKGMFNSTHGGSSILDRIVGDLHEPKAGSRCEVRSLVVDGNELEPRDHVIQSTWRLRFQEGLRFAADFSPEVA